MVNFILLFISAMITVTVAFSSCAISSQVNGSLKGNNIRTVYGDGDLDLKVMSNKEIRSMTVKEWQDGFHRGS